jgi:hypothetical protein
MPQPKAPKAPTAPDSGMGVHHASWHLTVAVIGAAAICLTGFALIDRTRYN